MQKVYIVLTHTGTLLSNFIKLYTKNDYSHVSLAFDENLNEMYSFGRLHAYNAFIGGFVREYLTKGTFKRFKNTVTAVYELVITDEQYFKIRQFVSKMYKKRKEYKFNFIGVFCVMFNKKVKREKALYCAEFVKYALNSGDLKLDYLPEIIKPEDFNKVKDTKLIYKGKLSDFRRRIRRLEQPKNDVILSVPTKEAV